MKNILSVITLLVGSIFTCQNAIATDYIQGAIALYELYEELEGIDREIKKTLNIDVKQGQRGYGCISPLAATDIDSDEVEWETSSLLVPSTHLTGAQIRGFKFEIEDDGTFVFKTDLIEGISKTFNWQAFVYAELITKAGSVSDTLFVGSQKLTRNEQCGKGVTGCRKNGNSPYAWSGHWPWAESNFSELKENSLLFCIKTKRTK